jgi:transcription termination factor NusB
MAKEAPWDDQTEMFVSDLNEKISKKYNINIRSLLISPDKYIGTKGMAGIAKQIRGETDEYFSDLMEGMEEEKQKLQKDLDSATSQYKQVDSIISSKAAASRVPYVKPLFISRDVDTEELVVVEQYDDTLDAFIGKLVNVSNYVADLSTAYKEFRMGSWLFSGAKNHVLSINPPTSPVLVMENSKDVIEGILDDIASRASE